MATDTISLHPVFPYRSLKEKQTLIKTGKLCIDSNVSEFFKRIQAFEHINAFNATFPFQGSNSQIGLLSGACIAIKDVLSFKETNLTCSSDILRNYAPPYTATSAQRLLNADAIILGA
ncbi:partial Glutamyl-tRNA(Gln) amidotransferase subunit A, partial [uncultured bacterium]